MKKKKVVRGFSRGRPSIFKIDFRAMKVGEEIHVPMDVTDKKTVHSRRVSYFQSAGNCRVKISTSIFSAPGHLTVRRIG
jgi:hypothetical protein